jgi:hypothetical protein
MLSWQGSGGFSIDAAVRIQADDRAGVERLLRYCARRPPRVRVHLVLAHLHEVDQGGAVRGGDDGFRGMVVMEIVGIAIPLGSPGVARSVVALRGHLREPDVPRALLLGDVPVHP